MRRILLGVSLALGGAVMLNLQMILIAWVLSPTEVYDVWTFLEFFSSRIQQYSFLRQIVIITWLTALNWIWIWIYVRWDNARAEDEVKLTWLDS